MDELTRADLQAAGDTFGLRVSDEEADGYLPIVHSAQALYQDLERLEDERQEAQQAGTSDLRVFELAEPGISQGWYATCHIEGRGAGVLAGRTVAVKDSICLRGIPMMHGSPLLQGFVPDQDATVVTRLLAAGAVVTGKSVCEDLSYSAGSHTAILGAVGNPYDLTRNAGGSSSGSAFLVAREEVDIALGGDQGGSIRIPAAWCGIYGMKPTWGLVPYTGAFPLEMTMDHVGPMARTVDELALALDAIAGSDGADPRQAGVQREQDYSSDISQGVDGISIGWITEGSQWPGVSDSRSDEAVLQATLAFRDLQCSVSPVSIPWHRYGPHLFITLATEGVASLMLDGHVMGTNYKGRYQVDLQAAFTRALREDPSKLPSTLKPYLMLGQHLRRTFDGTWYGRARNLSLKLTAAYDDALSRFDLLALPTTPHTAPRLPEPDVATSEWIRLAHGHTVNTSAFNVTGHPAISIPCGFLDGMPLGLMLVAKHGQEKLLLRAARAYEEHVHRWKPPGRTAASD